MRKNWSLALVAGCGLIAAVDLAYNLGRQSILPTAEGQTSGDDVILAASNTQNEAYCFVYNKKSGQMNVYMQRSNGGIELKGMRNTGSDFHPDIDEYPKSNSLTAVKKMKALIESLKKS